MGQKRTSYRCGDMSEKGSKADIAGGDTRTNCQAVVGRHKKIRNPNQRLRAMAALVMLRRVFSGCYKGAENVKFRFSTTLGSRLRRRRTKRPTERLNAPRRQRAHEVQASNRANPDVGVLFVSGNSPDASASVILITIADNFRRTIDERQTKARD